MKQVSSFEREFSALPGLQPAKTTNYALTEEGTPGARLYGIQVTEVGDRPGECDLICPFTDDRDRALLLLTYLFENAVPTSHCRSVINDACTAFDGIGWNDHGTGAPANH